MRQSGLVLHRIRADGNNGALRVAPLISGCGMTEQPDLILTALIPAYVSDSLAMLQLLPLRQRHGSTNHPMDTAQLSNVHT